MGETGDQGGLRSAAGRLLKRGMDLAVAGAVLVAVSPILVCTALALRVTMGSPVLFRQQRPGLLGRPFELMKFRTMRAAGAGEVDGPASDGARTTRLGRLLRAMSLDELPTLVNVLRGDMSLVGPRPLLMQYLDRYTPRQGRRHDVPPGITGWAQVNGRNTVSWEERFELDLWYVEHASFWLDLRILARTAWTVVRREGVSHPGAATMPEYMGPASASGPSEGAAGEAAEEGAHG
jgi:sugar transferase EpsL